MNSNRRNTLVRMAAIAALPRSSVAAEAEARVVSIKAFGAVPGADVRPAILAAVQSLAASGGGTVVIPRSGLDGWQLSGETRIEASNIRIELHDLTCP